MTYITLEEAKDHIRVDYEDDDHYIEALIDVVEVAVLNEVAGAFPGAGTVTTAGTTALEGYETNFLKFKAGDVIRVEGETNRTISTITDDDTLTVTSAFTTTETSLTWTVYPTALESSVLPKPLKQAMLIMIGELYNQREQSMIGASVSELPSFKMLVAPYKYWVCA